ncbi:MAG: DEAD/DEAH box helicase [Flavobacteriia bacterium]|jgi:ATP-dependent RNA helicase RhlE
MITFKDLNLSKQLWNALDDNNLIYPTSIQEKSFSPIMSGKDVIGIAQTGTGKTLAYLLPTLRQWAFSKKRNPQIVIVVPTRELVAQIVTEIEKLTAYMNVEVIGTYGGANIRTQADTIAMGIDVIVSTPGRLLDLALNGYLSLKDVKKLVIDEVDEMLDLGFRPQLTQLLEILPSKKQSLMFSATLSDDIEYFILDFFVDPIKVEAAPAGTPIEKIAQSAIEIPNFHTKIAYLREQLENNIEYSKVLIFVDSKKKADLVFEKLSENPNLSVGVIHSNKSQNLRFNTVTDFKNGNIKFLIATDLISRGIDISEVSHVINLDIPEEPENYIHRTGRTGRAEAEGNAISYLSPFEEKHWADILSYIKMEVPTVKLDENFPVSTTLIAEELPRDDMKIIALKLPKRENVGASFHEKKEKNKKVNVRKDWKKIKMDKYGRPITRGQKKKK